MKEKKKEEPTPLTKEQWRDMHVASLAAEADAMNRQALLRYKATHWAKGRPAPL